MIDHYYLEVSQLVLFPGVSFKMLTLFYPDCKNVCDIYYISDA